jgi:hypothetical protein
MGAGVELREATAPERFRLVVFFFVAVLFLGADFFVLAAFVFLAGFLEVFAIASSSVKGIRGY